MADPTAAAIAFFALGANVVAIAALLILNPHNRPLRWYAAFQALIAAWLAVQGLRMLHAELAASLRDAQAVIVHMLAALFLASAVIQTLDRPNRDGLLILLAGAVLSPIALAAWNGPPGFDAADAFVLAWNVVVWLAGSVLHARAGQGSVFNEAPTRLLQAVRWTLFLLTPAAVAAGFLIEGGDFFLYGMPLVTVLIQILLFIGVTHLRFYDIEVRAARTGELATAAAERERLVVLGEVATTVAHEVRNPLTGVRSLAQRLADETIDDARRRRYASLILEEVGRVDRIVGNLLGFARRGVPAQDPAAVTPLALLFDDVRLLLDARARAGRVELVVPAGTACAATPREPLAQALLNLVLNAVAATPAGGRVELSAAEAGGRVTIAVRDGGPGVALAERERIFEPFRTGGGGTGLGLAVVRRLADELGWTIDVDDAPGGGAEFRLTMAAAESRVSAGTGTAAGTGTGAVA